MAIETADVQLMSRNGGNSGQPAAAQLSRNVAPGAPELIDAAELAARWRVPESWIRNRTRARTPAAERIPCVRLGRYVRFEWGSPRLEAWLSKKRD